MEAHVVESSVSMDQAKPIQKWTINMKPLCQLVPRLQPFLFFHPFHYFCMVIKGICEPTRANCQPFECRAHKSSCLIASLLIHHVVGWCTGPHGPTCLPCQKWFWRSNEWWPLLKLPPPRSLGQSKSKMADDTYGLCHQQSKRRCVSIFSFI